MRLDDTEQAQRLQRISTAATAGRFSRGLISRRRRAGLTHRGAVEETPAGGGRTPCLTNRL